MTKSWKTALSRRVAHHGHKWTPLWTEIVPEEPKQRRKNCERYVAWYYSFKLIRNFRKQIREEIRKVKRTLKDQEFEKKDTVVVDSPSKKDDEGNNDVLRRFHEEQLKFAEKKQASIKKGISCFWKLISRHLHN